ncbi:hypothetical protein ACFW04_014648 [Cataglyphis niger]
MHYESRTTFTNNDRENDDEIQYEYGTPSIQDDYVDDKQILIEPRMNSTNDNHKMNFALYEIYKPLMNVEGKNDSTLHEFYENSSKNNNMSNIISYEMCYNITCIQLCCPLGDRLDDNYKCVSEKKNKYSLPYVYEYTNDSLQNINKTVNELFYLVIYDPCLDKDSLLLPDDNQYDYMFFANGSLYLSYFEIFAKSTSYCLAVVNEGVNYEVIICSETYDDISFIMTTDNGTSLIEDDDAYDFNDNIIDISNNIISISFLVPIFLVYSILPELRSVHGFMLCNYSGAMSVAYAIDSVDIISKIFFKAVHYSLCITFAFFTYFCYLASFFWLSVMSFDMWLTFRGFCSLQRNVRQRKKRKMVFYTIFAWGLSFIFANISIIMNFIPGYLPEILRPGFGEGNCWFTEDGAFALYFYGFKSICIVISICLSISTALKIAHYEKKEGNRLSGSESRRYNDNKKWFNLYLKLFLLHFIIMGISWSMNTIYLLYEMPYYYIYIIYLIESIQNLCIFIIFVWKKNIKRMLLLRFGCGLFSEE